jgi:hypothetical protein
MRFVNADRITAALGISNREAAEAAEAADKARLQPDPVAESLPGGEARNEGCQARQEWTGRRGDERPALGL